MSKLFEWTGILSVLLAVVLLIVGIFNEPLPNTPPIKVPTHRVLLNSTGFGSWTGTIDTEETRFKINLTKDQILEVSGDGLYSWSLVDSNGTEIGCNDSTYCQDSSETSNFVVVPETGYYFVSVIYRMCGGADADMCQAYENLTINFTSN